AHILHGDRRVAGNVAAQMLGENARFDVGGPARSKVDDEVKRFALIERRLLRGAAASRERRGEKNCRKATSPENSSHHFLLSDGPATVGNATNCFVGLRRRHRFGSAQLGFAPLIPQFSAICPTAMGARGGDGFLGLRRDERRPGVRIYSPKIWRNSRA